LMNIVENLRNRIDIKILLILCYLAISLIYLFSGRLHVDEGAYLYAARSVYDGKMLYKDFFFLQPPLHPLVYGSTQLLHPGLLTGRCTSILLGFASLLVMIRISGRYGGKRASLITTALIATNSFQIYFFSISRLYALTCFLLTLGFFFMTRETRPSTKSAVLTMVFFALALCTRITTLPVMVLGGLYLLLKCESNRARFISITSGILLTASVYGIFVLLAGPERLFFNLLGLNLSLHSHNLIANLLQKFRATSQLVKYYFFTFLLLTPILCQYVFRIKTKKISVIFTEMTSPKGILWVIFFSVLGCHGLAKIYQVSYQTIILPLCAVLIGIEWSRWYEHTDARMQKIAKTFFITGCFLSILSYGRESVSIVDGKPCYFALKEQADFVASQTRVHEAVFSADSALVVVEASRDILRGMAGSDLFPGWPTEKCRLFNVMNFEIMEDYIRNQEAKVLIYGDLSFSLSLPYLEPISSIRRQNFLDLIDEYYYIGREFQNLYIPGTRTYYLLARDIR